MTTKVNRKRVEISLLALFFAAASALLVEGVMGAKASQSPNQSQRPSSCPADPACDAIVRSLSASDDRQGTPAIRGESIASNGVGVLGVTSASFTFTTGVRGESHGIGVHGISSQNDGVRGEGPVGVRGIGGFMGVNGLVIQDQFDPPDITGVRGETVSFSGSGVLGLARATSTTTNEGQNFGVRGESSATQGTGVFGLVTHSTGQTIGVRGETGSADGVGVWAANTAGGTGLSVAGKTVLGGDVQVNGNLLVNGTKSSVAELQGGRKVALYAVESPENWFEDFGSAKLQDGVAIVRIKEDFAQTVNTVAEYHIFLTPKGNCNGLYVASQGSKSFEVRELNGGTSNTLLDYRIVAKRRSHETDRMREVRQSRQQLPKQATATPPSTIERLRTH